MGIPAEEEVELVFTYDFARDGGGTGQVNLKPLYTSIETGLHIRELRVFAESGLTSGGSPTVTFGHGDDPDGYLTDVFSNLSSDNGLVRSGDVAGALLWDDTNDHETDFRVDADSKTDLVMDIGTAALTGGKLSAYVKALKPGTV